MTPEQTTKDTHPFIQIKSRAKINHNQSGLTRFRNRGYLLFDKYYNQRTFVVFVFAKQKHVRTFKLAYNNYPRNYKIVAIVDRLSLCKIAKEAYNVIPKMW